MANQTQNLSAALSNFNQVLYAHDLALNSSGSAMQENSRFMESFDAKLQNLKASWGELVLAITNNDMLKHMLDDLNNVIKKLSQSETAINAILISVKALIAIGIGKKLIALVPKIVDIASKIKKVGESIALIGELVKHVGLVNFITTAGASLATFAPYVAIFLALGTAVGFASGKFQEMYNSHIAETSDDVNEVADAYLNLISAYKEFEHARKGTGAKKVTGEEALGVRLEEFEELAEKLKEGAISAQEFKDELGDVSDLENYYKALEKIKSSGGTLTTEQEKQYAQLKKLFKAYNDATTEAERWDKAQKISATYSNISKEAAYLLADSLVEVGGKYQFVSAEAKKASAEQLKTEMALTEQTIANISTRMAARLAEFGSMEEYSKAMLSKASPTGAGKFVESEVGQQVSQYYKLKKALEEIKKLKVQKPTVETGGATTSGTTTDTKTSDKTTKQLVEKYRKALEKYQKEQLELYQKGEISASKYYSNVQKKGESYYKKLKEFGEDYRKTNSTVVTSIFNEIDYKYKEGITNGKEYYNEIWKYANKFYKNGKLDFETYRDYITKGYKGMFDAIKKQYDKGEIDAEQYQKNVAKAISNAQSKISKSGLSVTDKQASRNALLQASVSAQNEVAKALKEAAIKASEVAVDAAEKRLEQAQNRLSKANTFISALQFYADKQTESIDKIIEGYNSQIDALNEQLDLMDKQNDALDKQAERVKLVNDLENAKKQKVRVYDAKYGWIWSENKQAVSQAQEALNEFDTEQKRAKEKQAIQDQIKALESLIKTKEDEKQAYQDVINEQTKALERYNIEAELGKTIEESIFAERIQNFENWKNSYISGVEEIISATKSVGDAQASLDYANAQLDYANAMDVPEMIYAETKTLGEGYTYSSDASATERWNAAVSANIRARQEQGYNVSSWTDDSGKLHYKATKPTTSKSKSTSTKTKSTKSTKKKASGSLSIPQSGIYNINELGDELVIPPKGNLEFLQKGTGIVPAHLTKNLMDWGKFNPSKFINNNRTVSSDDHSVTIQNLTVQSNDAKDFVKQLRNLSIVK